MMTTRSRVLMVCMLMSGSLWIDAAPAQPTHIEIQPFPSNVLIPSIRSHGFRVDREKAVKITDVPSQKQPGAFRLSYLMEKDSVTASLFAYPDKKIGGGYFLLLAGIPAHSPDPEDVQKREVTLVIDRSGSMRNDKIKQAKEAALQVIAGLKPGEAFNVLVYSNTVESFSVKPVIKTDKTEEAARQYIEGLTATGGTNIYDALKTALGQEPTPGMLPIVLFLTDGLHPHGVHGVPGQRRHGSARQGQPVSGRCLEF